jgi:HlyD family secretion protein
MVPGHVTELYCREGQEISKGDTVAFIDSPQVRAKMAQAQAARSAAQAQSAKARNGARQEQIAGAYELWQQALVQEDVMKKSFERIQNLYDQKVVAAQKYDETKAKYDAAVAQAKAAKSQYDMALSGARDEDKAAAAALVRQAEGAIQEVDSYMEQLYLTAPADGIVSNIYPRQGELVGQGSPVMTVTDLSDIWFTFNIREDQLHGMNTGDVLTLSVPALDGAKLQATVNYIAVRESYATWKATRETDQYDAKTFEVRAVPNETVEGLRPGMTVLVVK